MLCDRQPSLLTQPSDEFQELQSDTLGGQVTYQQKTTTKGTDTTAPGSAGTDNLEEKSL